MKEAGVLQLAGKVPGTSLAQKVTRIPGSGGGVKNALGEGRKLNKARVAAAAIGAAGVGAGVAAAVNRNKDQEKQAAVGLLIDSGVDFETAVDMVEKKASELEKAALVFRGASGYAGAKKGDKFGGTVSGIVGGTVAGQLAATALRKAGPGAAVGGLLAGHVAGGYASGAAYSKVKAHVKGDQEKKAAVGMLVDQGVDFETAVALVAQKAAELA